MRMGLLWTGFGRDGCQLKERSRAAAMDRQDALHVVVCEIHEGYIADVARATASDRLSVVGPTEDLDTALCKRQQSAMEGGGKGKHRTLIRAPF